MDCDRCGEKIDETPQPKEWKILCKKCKPELFSFTSDDVGDIGDILIE